MTLDTRLQEACPNGRTRGDPSTSSLLRLAACRNSRECEQEPAAFLHMPGYRWVSPGFSDRNTSRLIILSSDAIPRPFSKGLEHVKPIVGYFGSWRKRSRRYAKESVHCYAW